MNFNNDWHFKRETEGPIAGAHTVTFDDSSWRKLNLPHDWSIELDFNPDSPATHEGAFLDGGIGWYRKTFTIPESMKGKRIFIDFDGVYMNSTTYINGQAVGTYPFGYNAFQYDITDQVVFDQENVIAVKVDNIQPSSRWYSGSGIYRNVYLTAKDPIHVARYGSFVRTPNLEETLKNNQANIHIQTKVHNGSRENSAIKVRSTILNAAGDTVATIESASQLTTAGIDVQFDEQVVIENPELWDITHPYRYKLITEVIVKEQVVDTDETPFGIRYFEFDANEGFSLNGNYMKLHGVCMHHDLGALGAATNARGVERQMQIMKEMGVNAIRVSHNPASRELLEACNDLGLLVIEESFDCWNLSKKQYDYGRFFTDWAEHDTKEMVHRGKNEPCIIMWSIGNEIYDTTGENGVKIAADLCRWVKEVDTTRPTTIGEDKTRGDKVNVTDLDPYIKQIFDIVDVVGFNYSENNYVGYHDMHPEWKIYGAETSSATRSRGVYTHPYEYNLSTMYDDLQQSSYDNDYVGWGRTAEDAWKYDRDIKHLAGQFIWTGFDYLGEPTPYYNTFPAKSSFFGAVDTAGFPKDIFYYYQSQWTSEPMVHLLPHWNWTEGEKVRVLAYTNAASVELFLNDESLGLRNYESKQTSWGKEYLETADGKTYLEWAVPFVAGTLKAIAKDSNGNIIAEDKIVTAGEPARIKLTADRRVIDADGRDLSFVTVDVVDKDGNIVPTADHPVQFNLTGAGELVGVDNGNASSIERFKDTQRRTFNGKALAILQANTNAGEMRLTASSTGLASDTIHIFTHSTPADQVDKQQVGIDVTEVVTEAKQAPQLPPTVTVYYHDASVATKEVRWEAVDTASYQTAGRFTVKGKVSGTKVLAEAVITVKDIISIKPFTTAIKQGETPALPKTVTAFYNDETRKPLAVQWESIDEEAFANSGVIHLTGEISETQLPASARIRVTETGEQHKTASLTDLRLDGETIAGFKANKKQYELVLPFGSDIPHVTAESSDNASVVTILPATLPGMIKIDLTSEDGQAHSEYFLHIRVAEPALISAQFSSIKTDVTEDELIDLTIEGKLENGENIILTDRADITYHVSNKAIKLVDNTLHVMDEGSATLRATVTYQGVTITTPSISFAIAKNPVEKQLTQVDPVTVILDQGAAILLPDKVTAHYDHGLPRELPVSWNDAEANVTDQIGTTVITGHLAGVESKAKANIIVRGPVAVEQITMAILPKQTPILKDTVTVFYSDGTEESMPVKWSKWEQDNINTAGTFTVDGYVEQVDLHTQAHIRVTDHISAEQNIGRAKNGYNYPRAEASFTNNTTGTADQIKLIHDDVISYDAEPHNRWTNWQAEKRENDWVSITFGDYGPEAYFIDQMEIHWFEDEETSFPASFTIQYKEGEQWIDLEEVICEQAGTTSRQANLYTFDMVKTTEIRLNMQAQPEKAIGITEMKVFSKWPLVHGEPEVAKIMLENKEIIDQFEKIGENYATTIELDAAEDIPTVTASGNNNTSITIVPAQAIPSTTRIIARSEDDKKTIEYQIHFTEK